MSQTRLGRFLPIRICCGRHGGDPSVGRDTDAGVGREHRAAGDRLHRARGLGTGLVFAAHRRGQYYAVRRNHLSRSAVLLVRLRLRGRTRSKARLPAEVCHTGNAVPLLTSPGDQVTPVGQPVSVALSGVDPEGATLTYTVTGLPAGLTVAANTGIISGTPTQAGTSTVTATVSDGHLSATVSFSWVDDRRRTRRRHAAPARRHNPHHESDLSNGRRRPQPPATVCGSTMRGRISR